MKIYIYTKKELNFVCFFLTASHQEAMEEKHGYLTRISVDIHAIIFIYTAPHLYPYIQTLQEK